MKISDERLEKLDVYFVHQDIYTRYGVTFEQFVERCQRGTWEL